ncbi:outer membrane beta-barrel protein [Hymenobacter endophyticus]|uniref:Outer membrane beta-barrel protein n=1 Tax=Hymenobacter endophyticus TaxID=3076335 RepID=A0ABU3TH84_9BACT|nr:outer membrane beta-barrel protein [Hymenobacter endophyticus]MDU0370742.1 outer membrane beta-barrel protein [Hymenobacter endophyticus]
MLKVVPTALLLTVLAYSAQGQVQVKFEPLHAPTLRYGLRAGGQVMGVSRQQYSHTYWYNGATTEVPQVGLWGGNIGIAAEADFGWLALQPAVLFMQKGYCFQVSRTETIRGMSFRNSRLDKQRVNYLEVPVNAVITIKGIQLLAGPYVSVGVGGRYWDETSYPMGSEYSRDYQQYHYAGSGKVRFGDNPQGNASEAYVERRLDAGYNLGLGYRHNSWQVQPTYSRSIRSTSRLSSEKTWSAQLNLTYFFSPAS